MADQSRPVTGYPVPPSYIHHHQPNGVYPPPPQQQPGSVSNFFLDPNFRAQRDAIMRRVLTALLIVSVLFFALVFIFYLVLRAHRQVVHLTSLSVTDFNLSSSNQQLSGTWAARFEVYNPNKKITLEYDQIRAWLLYDTEPLAQNGIPPFSQDTQNTTVLDVSFNIINAFLDGSVVKSIDRDRADGAVGFDLRVQADVGFKLGRFTSKRRRFVKFLCENVVVGGLGSNSSSGNLTGGPKKCKVY